jgi:hypothetical protein
MSDNSHRPNPRKRGNSQLGKRTIKKAKMVAEHATERPGDVVSSGQRDADYDAVAAALRAKLNNKFAPLPPPQVVVHDDSFGKLVEFAFRIFKSTRFDLLEVQSSVLGVEQDYRSQKKRSFEIAWSSKSPAMTKFLEDRRKRLFECAFKQWCTLENYNSIFGTIDCYLALNRGCFGAPEKLKEVISAAWQKFLTWEESRARHTNQRPLFDHDSPGVIGMDWPRSVSQLPKIADWVDIETYQQELKPNWPLTELCGCEGYRNWYICLLRHFDAEFARTTKTLNLFGNCRVEPPPSTTRFLETTPPKPKATPKAKPSPTAKKLLSDDNPLEMPKYLGGRKVDNTPSEPTISREEDPIPAESRKLAPRPTVHVVSSDLALSSSSSEESVAERPPEQLNTALPTIDEKEEARLLAEPTPISAAENAENLTPESG